MKNNINRLFVYKNYTIKDVIKCIDIGAKGIALLVNYDETLLGTITDGDIRRSILKGVSLENSVENIVHYNPISVKQSMTREEIKDIFIKRAVKDIPIVDDNNKVLDLISINDILIPEGKENAVIIMAGGLGTRLKDLTKEVPKPMLKVGHDPILQHIIANFKQYGYNKILISVNYKSEIIENYFQDGLAYGVKIEYIKENKRLGTAGGIKLAEDYIDKPFFVINGDIFTNLNVENMMKFHMENKFDITVGTRKHSFQIPYGVIETENNYIKTIKEKPKIEYLINAGVYCLNPNLISLIPDNKYFEITDLIDICIKNGAKVGSYEITDYWMDIGRMEDYNKVNSDIYDLISADKVDVEDDK
ncbi:nucleotidyltransferase family protein [Clostridium tyrobutyricum]|uniref:nucleotidyltransferase family protein n=1 Tax=Clostridium tyrobutyricum TaxID=1519 RepID=UPI002B1EF33B|nr:nucleotidyltransferase family protein [Clostridium tyrobutyricum]MEA5009354.1 nucleotidyltransferase family protein [Clostridium tyrobutyricum]